jgi:hypothetical protein
MRAARKEGSMSDYKKQDWFNDEIFIYLQNELFGDIFEWPEGVTVEERETKPCDKWQKWSESHVVIKVDGMIAAEMDMGGKHGDSIMNFTVENRSLLAEMFKKMISA